MADIELNSIEKYFGKNYVIKKLNLYIKEREFLVLLGPSGCGKTTSLRAIAGLESIDAGEILIDGKRVDHLKASDRNIAFVFQFYALYPHLSVYENIAFPLKAMGENKYTIDKRVEEIAKLLGIESILKFKPSSLNSGDMQRVALGRAMIRRSKAILMDEPIGSLDKKLREKMRGELRRLHLENNDTTLYVTHDQIEAMSMGDKIAIMDDGILQQVGTPAEVYDHPANVFVAQFIGSPTMTLIDCTVSFTERETLVNIGNNGSAFRLSKAFSFGIDAEKVSNKQVYLGVRPEAVHLKTTSETGHLKAKVRVIEPLGHYDIVDIEIGDNILRAKVNSRFIKHVGQPVWIQLDEKRIHLFDQQTGLSLILKQ